MPLKLRILLLAVMPLIGRFCAALAEENAPITLLYDEHPPDAALAGFSMRDFRVLDFDDAPPTEIYILCSNSVPDGTVQKLNQAIIAASKNGEK